MTENKNDEKRTEPVGARFSFLIYANNEPKSRLREILATVAITRGNSRNVFSLVYANNEPKPALARYARM